MSAENELLLDPYQERRGLLLDLERDGGRRYYRVLKITEPPAKAAFPEVFPVRPVLYRVWGIRPPKPHGPSNGNGQDVLPDQSNGQDPMDAEGDCRGGFPD